MINYELDINKTLTRQRSVKMKREGERKISLVVFNKMHPEKLNFLTLHLLLIKRLAIPRINRKDRRRKKERRRGKGKGE